jgi:hypothetical protein
MSYLMNMVLSAAIISLCSWLAGKKPALAGFIIALPISSMIAIALTQGEWKDPGKSAAFAKSIFVSIPLSLTFFVPFLLMKQLNLPFWGAYAMGVVLLGVSYGVHRLVF